MSLRTVALFPGSFKPPHVRHLEAVQYLLARPDVDEVLIAISRRGRSLPGTDLALGVEVAVAVWRILLGDTPRVKLAVAKSSAIDYVRDLVASCSRSTRVLLCVGAEDLASGDRRFESLIAAARSRGVTAEVVAIPASRHGVRATRVRECIAAGPAGRDDFIALLGDSVSRVDKERIWLACAAAARPLATLAAASVREALERHGLRDLGALELLDGAPGRLAFAARAVDGRKLVLKHAGDEIGTESHGRPRYRLATERRALSYLARTLPVPGSVPELAFYDDTTRTIGTWLPAGTEPPSADRTAGLVSAAARWLAALHALPAPERALRGTAEREVGWWDDRLATLVQRAPEHARRWLIDQGRVGAKPGVFHLALDLDALRVHARGVLVTSFEDCSSFGDPAFDLGCLAASYIERLPINGAGAEQAALERVLDTYALEAAGADSRVFGRAAGFAAARLCAARGGLAQLGAAWLDARDMRGLRAFAVR
jgi:hypothetical protein